MQYGGYEFIFMSLTYKPFVLFLFYTQKKVLHHWKLSHCQKFTILSSSLHLYYFFIFNSCLSLLIGNRTFIYYNLNWRISGGSDSLDLYETKNNNRTCEIKELNKKETIKWRIGFGKRRELSFYTIC